MIKCDQCQFHIDHEEQVGVCVCTKRRDEHQEGHEGCPEGVEKVNKEEQEIDLALKLAEQVGGYEIRVILGALERLSFALLDLQLRDMEQHVQNYQRKVLEN